MKHSIELPVKFFATGGAERIAYKPIEKLEDSLPEKFHPEDGLRLNEHKVEEFSNNEIQVQPEDVRGHFIVIIHTRSGKVHRGLFELLLLVRAVINAGVDSKRVLIVFPYMPYSRSDKKDQSRISVASPFLAEVINNVCGIEKILLIEPHDSHICEFFRPAAKHLSTKNLFIEFIKREVFERYSKSDLVFMFPDAGSTKRYSRIPEKLSLSSAYINKERNGRDVTFKGIVGDIEDKICIFVDDEISSGKTMLGNAQIAKRKGAKEIISIITHPILSSKELSSEELMSQLDDSPIDKFVVTDTVPIRHKIKGREKFSLLSISGLLSQAINHIITGNSLSCFYDLKKAQQYYSPPKVSL